MYSRIIDGLDMRGEYLMIGGPPVRSSDGTPVTYNIIYATILGLTPDNYVSRTHGRVLLLVHSSTRHVSSIKSQVEGLDPTDQ